MLDGAGNRSQDADRTVADLPAMAVRAVEKVATPALPGALDVRQLVDGAGREEQPSRCERAAAVEPNRETALDFGRPVVDELHAVAQGFGPGDLQQLGRWHPVTGEKAVHLRSGGVTRRPRVDDGDAAPRPAEHERRTQSGSTAADHHDVIALCVHAGDDARERPRRPLSLLFLGTASSVAPWRAHRRFRACWQRSAPA